MSQHATAWELRVSKRSPIEPPVTLLRLIIEGSLLCYFFFFALFLWGWIGADLLHLDAGFANIFFPPAIVTAIIGMQRWQRAAKRLRLARYFAYREEGSAPADHEADFRVAEIVKFEELYQKWRRISLKAAKLEASTTERRRQEIQNALGSQDIGQG
jgi:hypothetical protein